MPNPFREELERRQSGNPFRRELERRQNEAMGAANAPARAEMPTRHDLTSQAFVRMPGDPQPTTGGQVVPAQEQPQSVIGSFLQGPQRGAQDVGVPGDPETTQRILDSGAMATGGLLGAAAPLPAAKIGLALLRSQFLGPIAGGAAGAEIARQVGGVDPMLGGVAGALLGRGRGR